MKNGSGGLDPRRIGLGDGPGMSLIELMIAVAIVGILAAIAYPSYVEHIRKSRRAEAQVALMSLAAALERHYTVKGSYEGAAADGGNSGRPTITAATVPMDGGTPTYRLHIDAADQFTFTIRATPTGAQRDDRCGSLVLQQNLLRSIEGARPGVRSEDCWRR